MGGAEVVDGDVELEKQGEGVQQYKLQGAEEAEAEVAELHGVPCVDCDSPACHASSFWTSSCGGGCVCVLCYSMKGHW